MGINSCWCPVRERSLIYSILGGLVTLFGEWVQKSFILIPFILKTSIISYKWNIWWECISFGKICFGTGIIIIIWPCWNCWVHSKALVIGLYLTEPLTWKSHFKMQLTTASFTPIRLQKWHDLWCLTNRVQFDIGIKLNMVDCLQCNCHQVILVKSSNLYTHEIGVQANLHGEFS